jgi:hypothetical protein
VFGLWKGRGVDILIFIRSSISDKKHANLGALHFHIPYPYFASHQDNPKSVFGLGEGSRRTINASPGFTRFSLHFANILYLIVEYTIPMMKTEAT